MTPSGPGISGMRGMTHYLELLASNQPWNLIFFMAILVILAEFIAVIGLYILFTRKVALGGRRGRGNRSHSVGRGRRRR